MNIYHIWADRTEDITNEDFVQKMRMFLDLLVDKNMMVAYRITQMKLGFRSMDIPDFHIMMEFESMQQLDDAMDITINNKQVDGAHVGFNQFVDVETIQHALYRDV